MQVKLTTEIVAEIFGAQPSTVKKHVLEIRDALVAAARQHIAWLSNVNRNSVLASLDFIVTCTTRIYQDAQHSAAQAGEADQNLPAGSPGQPAASVTAQSGTSTLTEHNQQIDSPENVVSNRKQQRDVMCTAEAVKKIAVENASTMGLSAYKRPSLVVTDLDSNELAKQEIIKSHEMGEYLHMKKRHCSRSIEAAQVSVQAC